MYRGAVAIAKMMLAADQPDKLAAHLAQIAQQDSSSTIRAVALRLLVENGLTRPSGEDEAPFDSLEQPQAMLFSADWDSRRAASTIENLEDMLWRFNRRI